MPNLKPRGSYRMREVQYCIWSGMAKQYVKRLTVSDTGVKITFTKHESYAAKVSLPIAARLLAKLVPLGKVRKHSGRKPSGEEALQEFEQSE